MKYIFLSKRGKKYIFLSKRGKWLDDAEDCIMKSYISCTVCHALLGLVGMCSKGW
jgi:hypothetical protein